MGIALMYAILPVLRDYEAGLVTGKVALGWTVVFFVVPTLAVIGAMIWVWSVRPNR